VSEWDAHQADVVILAVSRLELDAVLAVDAGAVPGSTWEVVHRPNGLPVAFRSFVAANGWPLRVAAATSAGMGATAALHALLPLIDALRPRCIGMCGVCAGKRGKTSLGDVVAAERLFFHDSGKQLPDRVEQDLTTYQLRDDWKVALERLDPVVQFRNAGWFQRRPLTAEWREHRALIALRDGIPEPWNAVEPQLGAEAWKQIVDALRRRKLLAASGRELTDEGRRLAEDLLFEHTGALPDLSPTGAFQPFRLHVAPMSSGTRVIEDEAIWGFVSQSERKTVGIDMEAVVLGELAHRQRQHRLDAVVMKGVMDFADHGRNDHFKQFAAQASAECLLWFLRQGAAVGRTGDSTDWGIRSTSSKSTADSARLPRAASERLDYSIERQRHTEFVGREAILAQLDRLLLEDDIDRWVVVTGGPGMGKSAILTAWLNRCELAGAVVPHHFIRRRLYGWDVPAKIVGSLAAQIEERYPGQRDPDAIAESRLIDLLGRVSTRELMPRDEHLVLLIDGLDEYDAPIGAGDPLATFLPHALPCGVRVLCGSRPRHPYLEALEVRGELTRIDLDDPSAADDNDTTVRALWQRAAAVLGLDDRFIEQATASARGNMQHAATLRKHLAFVPPAQRRVEPIPRGLDALLTLMWERVSTSAVAVHGLGILCAAREPLSLDELGSVAGWKDAAPREEFKRFALEFLTETRREGGVAEYRVHHDSLRTYIVEQIGQAAVRDHHAALARTLAAIAGRSRHRPTRAPPCPRAPRRGR
jgi:nucleoside phosphorylase